MAEETSSDIAAQYRLPSATTLQHVVKISITEDKPIMLDYWTGSLDKQVLIGMRESGDFIVLTENSIYLVSSDVETKRIS